MQDLNRDLSDLELRGIEDLLRDAAEFEPSRPAPIGIASRALASHSRPRSPRSVLWGVFGGLTLAGAAAAAAIILYLGKAPENPPRVVAENRPLAKAIPAAAIDPKESNQPKKRVESPPKITDAFERRKIEFIPMRKRYRTVRPPKEQKPVIAKAIVTEEKVHLFETGIIAPVLVARPDAESGATIMQTSLVEIPMEQSELVLREGYDSSHIRTISNEENP